MSEMGPLRQSKHGRNPDRMRGRFGIDWSRLVAMDQIGQVIILRKELTKI